MCGSSDEALELLDHFVNPCGFKIGYVDLSYDISLTKVRDING